MKKVLGILLSLFGIVTLATPLASEPIFKTSFVALNRFKAGESRVAPVCIVPPRTQKELRVRLTFPRVPLAPSSKQPVPLWLSELNQWRRMAGLHLVTENTHLSYGSGQHARYLVVEGPPDNSGFRTYDHSIGPRAHLEDSHRPSYTVAGAEAAIGGPLAADVIQGADVAWEGHTESSDIDNLITAPFHRLSLLAPWAQIGGYGSFGEYPRRAAALALRGPLEAEQGGRPIEFPPANSSISITSLRGSEWPNPIASCAGYEHPLGLPITLQSGRRLILRWYSLRDETSGSALEVCGCDAASYRNSDPTQQKRGRELLNAYGAILLIPRNPLSLGHQYRVTIQTSQGPFEWAFAVKGALEAATAEAKWMDCRQDLALKGLPGNKCRSYLVGQHFMELGRSLRP
jgi:hypothetical protein